MDPIKQNAISPLLPFPCFILPSSELVNDMTSICGYILSPVEEMIIELRTLVPKKYIVWAISLCSFLTNKSSNMVIEIA